MAEAVYSVSNKVSVGKSIAIGMWLEDDERYFKIRPLVSDRSQQYMKSALSVYIKKINKKKQKETKQSSITFSKFKGMLASIHKYIYNSYNVLKILRGQSKITF